MLPIPSRLLVVKELPYRVAYPSQSSSSVCGVWLDLLAVAIIRKLPHHTHTHHHRFQLPIA